VERDAHALEVIYSHLKLKQINQKMSGGVSNLPGFFFVGGQVNSGTRFEYPKSHREFFR
jgi:hypothetical protein